jgi:hypothetical protein
MNQQIATTNPNGGVQINLPHGGPARIGQGTAVEQSRAQSEVYYRVLLAHQSPRNVDVAVEEMRRSCSNIRLAEKAFYSMPRDGETVTGPSVKLARELARIWGNIDYGIAELRQDDEYAQSEMQAYAWDLQTNARSSQVFIVPHKRDTRKGPKTLTRMQDIYENNANAGARRVREAIFNVIPEWFTDEAQDICRETLRKGNGDPLEKRRAALIDSFKKLGVTQEQLVATREKESAAWDADDIAQLTILGKSIKNGEITKADAFPPTGPSVTADELAGADRADEQRDLEAEEGNR